MRPVALDLFCGAGGATQGLKDAGVQVLAGVESDPAAAKTYAENHPEVVLLEEDIRDIDPAALLDRLGLRPGEVDVLKSCPPCQPYSSLSRDPDTSAGDELIAQTVEWVRVFEPRVVLIENVPGVARSDGVQNLRDGLDALGYRFRARLLHTERFGVPQRRKRWIGIGVKKTRSFDLDGVFEPIDPERLGRSVEAALLLEAMPEATATHPDPHHRPRRTTEVVLERIRAIPPGGDRFDLPEHLELDCHKSLGRNATGPYGRIPLRGPGPTMTTRCTTPSCGRFVHPTLDRPITLREAAVLQTFPRDYAFVGTYGEVERQIGNAVPVKFVAVLTDRIVRSLRENAPT